MKVARRRGENMTTTETPHVLRSDGTEDTRYTVTWELTGHEDGRWAVARFDHHWIGEAPEESRAWELARTFARGRG